MSEINVSDEGYLIDGTFYPRVTKILARLTDFSRIDPETLEYARQRGTAVHQATNLDDAGTLDPETVDPAVTPYLEAWRRFRSDTNLEILESEKTVWSTRHRYAGTLDRIARIHGCLWVLDIKTGILGRSVGLQLAAYAATQGTGIQKRAAVQLRPGEIPSYRLIQYKDHADFTVFMACLTLHNWEIQHGA